MSTQDPCLPEQILPGATQRYQRQEILPDFGSAGQQALARGRVAVVGCGALGTHSADLLTRMGVGTLHLIDRDVVEWSNLHRQGLFDEEDAIAAIPKAQAARQRLGRVNRDVQIHAHVTDLNHENINEILADVDIIVDGLDNFETRYLLNDYAVHRGIPYVYGGAVGMRGMVMPICPRTSDGTSAWEKADQVTPCLRCLFAAPPAAGLSPTCDTAGVWPPVVSLVASLQVSETIQLLQGRYASVARQLLDIDLLTTRIRPLQLAGPEPQCPCCGQRRFDFLQGAMATRLTRLCGRNAVQYVPADRRQQVDLPAIAARLQSTAQVRHNEMMVRAVVTHEGRTVDLTIFPDGRALIRGTEDFAIARSLYNRFVGG